MLVDCIASNRELLFYTCSVLATLMMSRLLPTGEMFHRMVYRTIQFRLVFDQSTMLSCREYFAMLFRTLIRITDVSGGRSVLVGRSAGRLRCKQGEEDLVGANRCIRGCPAGLRWRGIVCIFVSEVRQKNSPTRMSPASVTRSSLRRSLREITRLIS